VGTLDHLRLLRLLGRSRRPIVRVLPPVHPPNDAVAHDIGRSSAWRDRRGRRHACRSGRRCGDRRDPEELRLRVSGALEYVAGFYFRVDRDFHAGRCGPRRAPLVATLEKTMTPALQWSGLKKAFGGVPATNDVPLEVMPGEHPRIIGPNGAGKTTLFNLITGDLAPDAGSIRVFGEEVSRIKSHQRAHRGLARTYQIITLFAKDSLEHNIVLSLLGLSKARWNSFTPLAARHSLYAEARRVLGLVGLEERASRSIGEVSYGEK